MLAAERRTDLLRVLGVVFGVAVTVGNTIGAGILRTPGDVAANIPSPLPYLLIWIAGAAYALLGANALAELATMLPRSGGQYVFARHALGEYAGFVVGWSDWLSTCGTTAAVGIVVGEYLAPVAGVRPAVTAALIIIAFAAIQSLGVESGGRAQELTTALKALAFVGLIVACFAAGGSPERTAVATGTITFGAIVIALQAVIYTYDGWSGVVYFSEEVRNPARDIPRAMFAGVLLVAAIYLLLNLAFLAVVPIGQLAGDEFVAGTVATRVFGALGDPILRILMVISMLSAINAYELMASRVLFAVSRDRLFWSRGAEVNRGGTPIVALVLSTIVSLLFLLTGTFESVTALLAFFFVANYTLSFASLFVLRAREPRRERPFRAWGHPWTTGLALVASLAFLAGAIASDTANSLYSLALLAASWVVYRFTRRRG